MQKVQNETRARMTAIKDPYLRARLADAGIAPSVGSQGDAYDNALMECVIGLYKTEVIYGPTKDPGRQSKRSNWPPCHGCTGTTPNASTATSVTSHPTSMRRPTTLS